VRLATVVKDDSRGAPDLGHESDARDRLLPTSSTSPRPTFRLRGVSRDDVRVNLESWENDSDNYQARNRPQLDRDVLAWGIWDLPEDEIHALGDVDGIDALELGCGGAQFGLRVAARGARVMGLDFSEKQLRHAVRNIENSRARFPLVRADAEQLPLADASFDLVFCDHGATSFTDPARTFPEVGRVLRPGGRFVFNMSTPFIWVCWGDDDAPPGRELRRSYFDLGRDEYVEGDDRSIQWQLTYGRWIRLFRESGFVVEDLIELRPSPDATTTYTDYAPLDWARSYPGENIWRLRKTTS
jgi:SAM-dependent methyltransferase